MIPIRQNNDLSDIALNELRMDLDEHALHQRYYTDIAYLAGNSRKYSLNSVQTVASPLIGKKILFWVLPLLLVLALWVKALLIIFGSVMALLQLKMQKMVRP